MNHQKPNPTTLTRKPNTNAQYRELILNHKKANYSWSKNPTTLLDYGCGYGNFLPYYQDYYPYLNTVHGYDILLPIREPSDKFQLIDDLSKGLPKYDLIIANHVFDTLPPSDRFDSLQELFQHLAPGGEILATVDIYRPFDKGKIVLDPRKAIPAEEHAAFWIATENDFIYSKAYRTFEFLYELEWASLSRSELKPISECYYTNDYTVGVIESKLHYAYYVKSHKKAPKGEQ